MGARGWIVLLVMLGLLDAFTAVVSPRDAWNPLHPHPAHWHQPPPIRQVVKLKRVCPWKGLDCYWEAK